LVWRWAEDLSFHLFCAARQLGLHMHVMLERRIVVAVRFSRLIGLNHKCTHKGSCHIVACTTCDVIAKEASTVHMDIDNILTYKSQTLHRLS
jgi:hypothetical protein